MNLIVSQIIKEENDQGREFYNNIMQEWLENNDILIFYIHDEGKSVIAERFIKTLKTKIYKKVTANENKYYLPYLIKLVDQYNNTYHHSINKKLLILIILLWIKKLRQILKPLNIKRMNNRVRIAKYKNIFSKGYTKNWSREMFIIDSIFKTNPWTYKIKDLNGEKIIGNFYEKQLLRSKL